VKEGVSGIESRRKKMGKREAQGEGRKDEKGQGKIVGKVGWKRKMLSSVRRDTCEGAAYCRLIPLQTH
jgi:hypothetical protein